MRSTSRQAIQLSAGRGLSADTTSAAIKRATGRNDKTKPQAALVLLAAVACLAALGCGAPPQTTRLNLDTIELFDEQDSEFGFGLEAGSRPDVPATYTVRRGDTLSSISRTYGVSVAQIKRMNGLLSNTINVGMELRLRADNTSFMDNSSAGSPSSAPSGLDGFVFEGGEPGFVEDLPEVTVRPGTVSSRGYQWPVEGRVLSRYSPAAGMDGIEIKSNRGSLVTAAREGTVVFRGFMPRIGNVVVIEHAFKYLTLYGYLGKTLVNVNDQISRGDVIATVGSSGAGPGDRLHFRVYVNYGNSIDPMKVLQ